MKPGRPNTIHEKKAEKSDHEEISEIFSASEAEVRQFFEWFDAQRAIALVRPGRRARKNLPSKTKK